MLQPFIYGCRQLIKNPAPRGEVLEDGKLTILVQLAVRPTLLTVTLCLL